MQLGAPQAMEILDVSSGFKCGFNGLFRPCRPHAVPIDRDKALVKDYLRQAIGADYRTATTPSDANLLQVDMADWGRSNRGRQNAPWRQME
eukprot:1622450-Prymnesium_polylepis.1